MEKVISHFKKRQCSWIEKVRFKQQMREKLIFQSKFQLSLRNPVCLVFFKEPHKPCVLALSLHEVTYQIIVLFMIRLLLMLLSILFKKNSCIAWHTIIWNCKWYKIIRKLHSHNGNITLSKKSVEIVFLWKASPNRSTYIFVWAIFHKIMKNQQRRKIYSHR